MERTVFVGRILFAIAIAALGIQSVISSDFVFGLQPVPAWIPGRLVFAYLSGILLVAAGVSIAVNKHVRLVASWLGLMLFLWVLLLHVPRVATAPRDPNAWTTAFETLALCGAAWALAEGLATDQVARPGWDRVFGTATKLGRFLFGVSLPVFGIQHFMYADFVATLVPAWIPARLFWSYFVGVAFLAAGVSIVTGVKARLAGTLLGIMFGTWVLILHAPRVAAHPRGGPEWTSLFIALAMCGGAWLVARTMASNEAVVSRETSDRRTMPERQVDARA